MTTLALIGYGNWGRNYASTLKDMQDTSLKYICTRRTIKNYSEANYTFIHDYKKLLSSKDIDGVIIATPASTHFKIAKDFLENGFNVLLEKPIAINLKDSIALQRIQEKKKNVFMVGHIYLYNPAFIALKNQLHTIGKIKYLDFEDSNWGPFRDDVSSFWDWGSHDLSMCLDILGNPILIEAWSMNEDQKSKIKNNSMVYIKLSFLNNIKAFFKIGSLSLTKVRKISVFGVSGSLLFDDLATNNKVMLFSNRKIGRNSIGKDKVFFANYSDKKPLNSQLEEFLFCIQKRKEPYSNIKRACEVSRVMDAIEQSIIKGLPIKIK